MNLILYHNKEYISTQYLNKMYMKVFILALILLLSRISYTQQQDMEIIQEPENQQFINQQQQLARRQQQFSMKRTACLVLSRYHSNTHKQMIQSIFKELAPEDQNKFINKLYATAVEHCLPIISLDEAQQFFVESSNFNPAQMFYIYDGFDYGAASNDLDHLTPEQKSIIKFIKQFDEEMAVKKQQREAEEMDAGLNTEEQMTLFWIPLHGWGSKAQIAYIVVLLGILSVGFCWGFSNLNNSTQESNKNKKKHKKGKKDKNG